MANIKEQMAKRKIVSSVGLKRGDFIDGGGEKGVWYYTGKTRRYIPNPRTFDALGGKWLEVKKLSAKDMVKIKRSAPIKSVV